MFRVNPRSRHLHQLSRVFSNLPSWAQRHQRTTRIQEVCQGTYSRIQFLKPPAAAQAERSNAAARVFPPPWARRNPLRTDERQSTGHEFSIPQPKFARCFPAVERPSPGEESSPQNFLGEQSKRSTSEWQFEKKKKAPRWRHSRIGEGASRQRCVQVPITLRKQCVGLKQYKKLFRTIFIQATRD